jgi:hypothetical protein
MAQHLQFRVDTNVEVYFCDPHSPWQRGSNENANGLLRQYFPKGTSLRASAGPSAASLTVSETWAIEIRSEAIAVFFAIGCIAGALGPALCGP